MTMNPGKHFIIGTAGHIDHGKTALVKALTGINADRLKEEQERGMTIDLGYAYLDLAGARVGIVDVPGHEKFVKNMLAGATGIDLALLVVAADDGVMPQTTEHLEVLDLLAIKPGLVVVTKIDLVEDDLRTLVRQEVENLLHGTTLEGSEIAEVSSATGEGIDDLRTKLQNMIAAAESRRPLDLPFRMPIDRVFSQPGFGCVVTGSVATGTVPSGATLEIVPGNIEVRLRGIQVHGQVVEVARAGQRTALNLNGVKADQVARGHVLSIPGHLVESELLDVQLRLLKSARRPLRHNDRVRLHTGTTEVMARVSLLAGNQLKPGETAFAQLKSEQPVVAQRRDRYVIRSYSPMRTIGGGIVLRRNARRLKRNRPGVIAALRELSTNNAERIVVQTIRDTKPFTLTPDAVAHIAELPLGQVERTTRELCAAGQVIIERGNALAHEAQMGETNDRILRVLRQFHKRNRLAAGMVPAQLVSRARVEMPPDVFAAIIDRMKSEGKIKVVDGLIAATDFAPRLSPEEKTAAKAIKEILRSAGPSPPLVQDVLRQTGLDPMRAAQLLETMVHTGQVVRLSEHLCYDPVVLDGMKAKTVDLLQEAGQIGVGDLKNLLGVSRKFAIPILEYLDRIGVTERIGDKRKLNS
ncbi:MAG: selenocysteine-specific translation elongation factor [Planctomycetes bacterium]|nr:selenocysteine-specific translation elongation factor [Planctomycetota bacterium]